LILKGGKKEAKNQKKCTEIPRGPLFCCLCVFVPAEVSPQLRSLCFCCCSKEHFPESCITQKNHLDGETLFNGGTVSRKSEGSLLGKRFKSCISGVNVPLEAGVCGVFYTAERVNPLQGIAFKFVWCGGWVLGCPSPCKGGRNMR